MTERLISHRKEEFAIKVVLFRSLAFGSAVILKVISECSPFILPCSKEDYLVFFQGLFVYIVVVDFIFNVNICEIKQNYEENPWVEITWVYILMIFDNIFQKLIYSAIISSIPICGYLHN